MIIDLTGKRAIVSGSTLGIGFAIAQGLAASGATVVINGPSQKSVDAALSRLAEMMPKARVEGIAADLSGPDGVAAFVARARETDILVNNLGIFEPKPFDAITDADWQRFFETNVMSGVRLSRHYLPDMVKRGWGRIVFISSESGLNIPVEMIHYGMTKTAQLAISLGLAVSVAGTGVTVNAVLPGPTRSDGAVAFYAKLAAERGVSEDEMERQFIATHRPTSVIRRLATVEEVANMVVYVCSEQASPPPGRRCGSTAACCVRSRELVFRLSPLPAAIDPERIGVDEGDQLLTDSGVVAELRQQIGHVSVHRRANYCPAEIELRFGDGGLVQGDDPLGLMQRTRRLLVDVRRGPAFVREMGLSVLVLAGIVECSAIALRLGLRLLECNPIVGRIDFEKRVAFVYELIIRDRQLDNSSGHLGRHGDDISSHCAVACPGRAHVNFPHRPSE